MDRTSVIGSTTGDYAVYESGTAVGIDINCPAVGTCNAAVVYINILNCRTAVNINVYSAATLAGNAAICYCEAGYDSVWTLVAVEDKAATA